MPVLNRAERSRTGVVFVALVVAICATSAVAREFRAADTQTEDYPTVQALRYMGALIAERSGGRHDILIRSIEHMRKVLDGPIGSETLGGFGPCGLVGLALCDSGARSIYNGLRPVKSVVYARTVDDPAATALIERIRKVE
ncbi:TRAP-type C4-dicarboxylate transport system substrate-binding protein [Bradyrhizobium sp. LB7.2]